MELISYFIKNKENDNVFYVENLVVQQDYDNMDYEHNTFYFLPRLSVSISFYYPMNTNKYSELRQALSDLQHTNKTITLIDYNARIKLYNISHYDINLLPFNDIIEFNILSEDTELIKQKRGAYY
jgi:hypothetical protein